MIIEDKNRNQNQRADIELHKICEYTKLSEKAVRNIHGSCWAWILSTLLETENFDYLLALLEDLRCNAEYLEEAVADVDRARAFPEANPFPRDSLEKSYNTVCTIQLELLESFQRLLEEIVPTEKLRAAGREYLFE